MINREWIRSWRGPMCRLGNLLLAAHLAALAGCEGLKFGFLDSSEKPGKIEKAVNAKKDNAKTEGAKEDEGDGESLILRPTGLTTDKAVTSSPYPDELKAQLEKAREWFRLKEYAKAEDLYTTIADKEKNPPQAIQEGLFYRAECLRLQGHLPKSADTYSALLQKFPSTSYREQCLQHMYAIADRWLDDTREQMKEAKEKQEGKRWLVSSRYVSFERAKPLFDREGRAIEVLEKVRMHDVNGPLADKSLFLCGVVKMYNENFRDADHYFTQIYARHPESPLAPKAIELGIQCKHLSTGGSDYDGRKAAEARKMVTTALHNYPQLAHDPKMREFLERQHDSIDMQQAEKEYKMAEFYRRTGHPGSAYFYYELVRRRYPGTKYAKMAEQSWNELRAKVEKEHGVNEPMPQQNAPVPTPQVQPTQPGQPNPLPAGVRR